MACLGLGGTLLGLRLSRTEAAVLMGTLLVGTASAARAVLPLYALIETLTWLAMLVAVFVIARSAFTKTTLRVALWIIAFLNILYGLSFTIGYLAAAIERLPLYRDDLFLGFSNIRFYGQFQTWTLPLLMTKIVLSESQRERRFWWLLAALGWGLLFVSGTRGTLLGLFVSTVVVTWLFGDI